MVTLKGTIIKGSGEQRRRMMRFPEVFESVLGKDFYPGTINVKVDRPVWIKTDFKISGDLIAEPHMNMLFEKCKINGDPAYRMRIWNKKSGYGSWGDDVLEIAGPPLCVPTFEFGICQKVKIELFRNKIKFWHERRKQRVVEWYDYYGRKYTWVKEGR